MKRRCMYLLCALALLPAALVAQNVDVGIAWDPPLPDTVVMGTPVTPGVRATNYGTLPASFHLAFSDGTGNGETLDVPVLQGGDSIRLTLGSYYPFPQRAFVSHLIITNDTNPANDTIRHSFILRPPSYDIGLAWDPPLPDTIGDSTFIFTPRVGVVCYTRPVSPINLNISCMLYDDTAVVYDQIVIFWGYSGEDTAVSFPDVVLHYPIVLECSVCAGRNDTNPANDTVWWRPHLSSGVEEPAVTLLPKRQLLPSHFSSPAELVFDAADRVFIYDASGKLVRCLASGNSPAGNRVARFDGRDSRGRQIPAGVYFVRLEMDEHLVSEKVVLSR